MSGYPAGWPRCGCGKPVMDGHLTCGEATCSESAARDKRVSHSVSHATPAEQLKFLTDEARKALAIFNRLPMQEYFKRNAENDVLALAIEQASDHIATALNILSAQPTSYEFDPYGEAEQAGMQFALGLFARQIAGASAWEGGDGSETVEGDVLAEFNNIAKAVGWVDEHGDVQFGPLTRSQRPEEP